jgi:hypothetical protein
MLPGMIRHLAALLLLAAAPALADPAEPPGLAPLSHTSSLAAVARIRSAARTDGGCTAVLIAPDLALTAGHCARGAVSGPRAMRLIFRPYDTPPAFQVTVRAVAFHEQNTAPGLDAANAHADVALLRLAMPVPAEVAAPSRWAANRSRPTRPSMAMSTAPTTNSAAIRSAGSRAPARSFSSPTAPSSRAFPAHRSCPEDPATGGRGHHRRHRLRPAISRADRRHGPLAGLRRSLWPRRPPFHRSANFAISGPATDQQKTAAMHDIRAIREAPEAFDAALARRGLAPQSSDILSLDEARRACIQAAEAALAERNAASKDVGRAKARATRRNSSASARWWPPRRTRSPRWRRKPRKRTPPCATCSPASRTCPMTTSPTARTKTTTWRFTAGAPRASSTSRRGSISS